MAGIQEQLKLRAKDLKSLFKKGTKIVDACKKGWLKVKKIKG